MFDKEDDVGTSTIPDLSLPSEDEKEDVKDNNVWECAINDLFNLSPLHAEGKSLENGSSIKIWIPWNYYSNGMKMA